MQDVSTLRSDLRAAPFRDFQYPRLDSSAGSNGAARWRPSPATFRVEEIPAYPASGAGEHAWLVVEKEGLATREVAVAVARKLALPASAVGYAGMKDKHATAVQTFSVTGVEESVAAAAFTAAGCRVLDRTRHGNKLRLGHLGGNRFRIWLARAARPQVEAALDRLAAHGVPNYYGPQRFGARGDNAWAGAQVLRGTRRVKRWQRDLYTSALQSLVFNEVLARRIETGTLQTAVRGDVLRREDSGGLFLCEDPATEQPRVADFAVNPTGPMPGRKMVCPQGAVAAEEAAVLADLGLEEATFASLRGARRALRVAVAGARAEAGDDGVWVEFSLPGGAFASVVVGELV